MHAPTHITIYIDAGDTDDTRTIMLAELAVMHTALATIATHEWVRVFTDTLSSLQAFRHNYTNQGTKGPNIIIATYFY